MREKINPCWIVIWVTTSILIYMILSSTAFSAQPGFGTDWDAFTYSINADSPYTPLEHWVEVIDHDGIASDGSSHHVTVTYPDTTDRTLNFRYLKNATTAIYEYWDNSDLSADPMAYSGDYVYRVTDNTTGEWAEKTDHLDVNPIPPPDETFFSPGYGAPVSMAASFDEIYVNGVLYDDFDAGFDPSKWENMVQGIVSNSTQVVTPGSIVVDGNGSDWAGLNPALIDPQGDSAGGAGADIKHVYTAVDATYAYIMVETYSTIDPNAGIEINFDYKPFQHFGHDLRDDLHTTIGNSTLFAWNDADMDGNLENFPINGYTVVRGNVMEARIPLSEVENSAYFNPTFVNIWTPTAPPSQGDDPSYIAPSISDRARFEYTWDTANGKNVSMQLLNPETVNELTATFRVESSVGNAPYARIGGSFCHDGIGEITARIGIRGTEAVYVVYREYMDGDHYMVPQLLPTTHLGALTPGNRYKLTLGWNGSTLSFAVQGIDDAIYYSDTYSPSGTLTTPASPNRFIGLSSYPFLNTTAPEFNWQEVTGAAFYRVRIYSSNDQTLFTGYTKQPPYQLPPGVLIPNAIYKYRIRAVREHQWLEGDNTGNSDRNIARFITGPTEAQAPFLDLHSHGVYTWTHDVGTFTSFYVKIHDAQGVPGNIQSVKVLFPDGTTEIDLYHDYNETTTRGIYRNSYFGPPQAGDYIFTVTDKDLNTDSKTDTLILDTIGYPSESSLLPEENTLLNDTALTLDWDDVTGAAFYQVDFYDKNLDFKFRVRNTDSQFSLWPGLLEEQSLYRFRVLTWKDFWEDNQNAGSSSPPGSAVNAKTFFTTAVHGSHQPQVTPELLGVACIQAPHPYTGTPTHYLTFELMVQDLDGVPENIQKVEVTYPDGVTKKILNYLDNPNHGRNYYAEELLADLSHIQDAGNSSGVYTFEVTDFDNHTITLDDTLPKAGGAGGHLLPGPSGLAPVHGAVLGTKTPVISWDPVPGAVSYRVRIYNAAARSTLHWSPGLVDTFYTLPCGLLDPDTTYAYRVYAYDAFPDSDIDFVSANLLYPDSSYRFTTGNACTGDYDQDDDIDGVDLAEYVRRLSQGTTQITLGEFVLAFGR